MMGSKSVEDMKAYIAKELPRVLEKDPNFVIMIRGILAEHFPTRDEFTLILNELREMYIQTEMRFQQMEQQINQVRSDINAGFNRLENEIRTAFHNIYPPGA